MDPWGEPTLKAPQLEPSAPERGAGGGALLGELVAPESESERVHQVRLETGSHPWLQHHLLEGEMVLPMAFLIEMVRLASESTFGPERESTLTDVRVDAPLIVDASDGVTVQTVINLDGLQVDDTVQVDETVQVKETVQAKVRANQGKVWTRHLSARILLGSDSGPGPVPQPATTADSNNNSSAAHADAHANIDASVETSGDEYYRSLADIGLSMGPTFRLIQSVRRGRDRVEAGIVGPEEPGGYRFHPAVLDACLHTLGLAVAGTGALQDTRRETYLPVSIARWSVFGASRGRLTAFGTIRAGSAENPVGDLRLLDDKQRCVAELEGVRFARTSWTALGRRGGAGEGAADLLEQLKQADFRDRTQILEDGLKSAVRQVLDLDASEPVDVERGLSDLGMDSVQALELSMRVGELLALDLPATLVFEHPTISALAEHLRESLQSIVDFGTGGPADYSEPDSFTASDGPATEDLSVADLTDALMDALDDAGY